MADYEKLDASPPKNYHLQPRDIWSVRYFCNIKNKQFRVCQLDILKAAVVPRFECKTESDKMKKILVATLAASLSGCAGLSVQWTAVAHYSTVDAQKPLGIVMPGTVQPAPAVEAPFDWVNAGPVAK